MILTTKLLKRPKTGGYERVEKFLDARDRGLTGLH